MRKKIKATFILVQKGFFVHAATNSLISLQKDYLLLQAIFGIFYQKLKDFLLFFLSVEVLIMIV